MKNGDFPTKNCDFPLLFVNVHQRVPGRERSRRAQLQRPAGGKAAPSGPAPGLPGKDDAKGSTGELDELRQVLPLFFCIISTHLKMSIYSGLIHW